MKTDLLMTLVYLSPGNFVYVIGIVPKQPRTQALTHSIINRYPDIAAHNWKWTKGEGLSCGLEKIKFSRTPVNFDFHPNYPGIKPTLPSILCRANGYRYNLNHEKNGVEIRFDGVVPSEITDCLKCHGFRYSGKMHLWYARQTPETIMFAKKMKGG